MMPPHRIRTLRLDLRAADPEEAFRLRQTVAATVQSAGFASGLETLLDRLAPGGTEYRIERLDVPLDGLTAEAWERGGTARLLGALETALTRELRRTAPKESVRGVFSGKRETPLPTAPASGKGLDAFAYFLQTGRLPWWADPSTLTTETGFAELLQEPAVLVGARLASVLSQPEAARRLVWQFPPKLVFALLEHLSGADAVGQIRRWETGWVRRFREEKKPSGTLREALEAERIGRVQRLAERAWRADASWLRAELARMEEVESASSSTLADPVGVLASSPENPALQPPSSRGRTGQNSEAAATKGIPAPGASDQKNAQTPSETAFFPKAESVVFIANAGLVLLHPFLAPLLAELGFLENGRFRSENHQRRAVHLLAYLAGQGSFSAESELVLPKLLLGLLPEMPVRRRVRLARTEKAEARSLLLAVIEHWSVLKNTSVEALQAEFLRREGRLERRDDARATDRWHLTVEQRASDVLLGRLPWGISMIRLPWMTDWLHVNWA